MDRELEIIISVHRISVRDGAVLINNLSIGSVDQVCGIIDLLEHVDKSEVHTAFSIDANAENDRFSVGSKANSGNAIILTTKELRERIEKTGDPDWIFGLVVSSPIGPY
jgi:hypothetical protein